MALKSSNANRVLALFLFALLAHTAGGIAEKIELLAGL